MCLIFIVQNQHPDFSFIIAANRDEFHARESTGAHFWPTGQHLLAGKDMQAGGTWLGVTRQGQFAAVTNYRAPDQPRGIHSRGHLVSNFLQNRYDSENYTDELVRTAQHFTGFNCIYGSLRETAQLHFFSNHDMQHCLLSDGIHGISNASLNSPWPKITQGKQEIRPLLERRFNTEDWLEMLADRQIASDGQLPDTGIGLEQERLLSARFIQGQHYGTQYSTVITVSRQGNINFTERHYQPDGKTLTQHFSFTMDQSCDNI